MMNPGNGQWVRTHNEEGVETFAAEKDLELQRELARLERSRLFRQRMLTRLRSVWGRARHTRAS